MKQQSIGIVLCALLLSTFGHELLQRHQVAHSTRIARSPVVVQPQTRSHLLQAGRANTDSQSKRCPIICDPQPQGCGGNGGNLTIAVNEKTGLVLVANFTGKVAIIIDTKANLIGIFDGTTNKAIILNYKEKTGVVIDAKEIKNILKFFQNLKSLKDYEKKGGEKFNENNIKAEISVQIRKVLIQLSGGELTVSEKEAFGLIIEVALRLSVSLEVVLKVLESSSGTISITLRALIQLLDGLAQGFGKAKGGVDAYVQKKIKFNLNYLIKLGSSLAIAVYVEIVASSKGVTYDKPLTPTNVLLFIALWGGNSTAGVNGVFLVLADIAGVLEGTVSVQVLIEHLIQFSVDNSGNDSLAEEFKSALDKAIKTLQNAKSNERIKVFLEVLIKIRDNNLNIGGVNLGDALKILLSLEVVLAAIIGILVLLRVRISIGLAIAHLFVNLFVLLVEGYANIVGFIIGLEIKIGFNILREFVRALIAAGGNLVRAIAQIEILNQICAKIDISLKGQGLEVTVIGIFSDGGIVRLIIELLEISFGIKIGVHGGTGKIGTPISSSILASKAEASESDAVAGPNKIHYDAGGNAINNSSQTFEAGSVTGSKENITGGTNSGKNTGNVNINLDNDNNGGSVDHKDNNNNTRTASGSDPDKNKDEIHVAGNGTNNSNQGFKVGTLTGSEVNQGGGSRTSTAQNGGNVGVNISNGNKGGNVTHGDNNNNQRAHPKDKKGGVHQK